MQKNRHGGGRRRVFLTLLIVLAALILLYCVAVFSSIPFVARLRALWIETALTTADHQWLATAFIPERVINEVMEQKVEDSGEVGITLLSESSAEDPEGLGDGVSGEALSGSDLSPYGLSADTIFTDTDEFGNTVLVNDREQGIKIVKIETGTYTGFLTFVDDPSRVFVETTRYKGMRGELICDYLSTYDAIVGINANGFLDEDGVGMGGEIIGCTVSDGELWGTEAFSNYTTIGFDSCDRLIVGKIDDYRRYDLKNAAQFKPILILDGEILTDGSAGWGIQPRTIVAQRSDGIVMFLVVDGRKLGYSIGITMGDAAEILSGYGAVTAAACDGGSSSVLAYDGEIINIPSTPMTTGRYLPNAFLVRRK